MDLDRISFAMFVTGISTTLLSLLTMLSWLLLAAAGNIPLDRPPNFPLYGILTGLWIAAIGGALKIAEKLIYDD